MTTTPPPTPAPPPMPATWPAATTQAAAVLAMIEAAAATDLAAAAAMIHYDARIQQLIAETGSNRQRGQMLYTLATLPLLMIATGQTPAAICAQDPRLPPYATIRRWRLDYKSYAEAENHATTLAASALAAAVTGHQVRTAALLARGSAPAAARLIGETQSEDAEIATRAADLVLTHDEKRIRLAQQATALARSPEEAEAGQAAGMPTIDQWRQAAAARRQQAAAALARPTSAKPPPPATE